MISPTLDSFRITLHILAAAVWVGGQIVLGAIVPKLRQEAPEALRVVANGFAKVAWPAFILAVFTGMWTIFEVDVASLDTSYQATLGIKVLAVAVAGFAAAAHSSSQRKIIIALGGAIGLLASLGAVYLGVLLASAT